MVKKLDDFEGCLEEYLEKGNTEVWYLYSGAWDHGVQNGN